MPYVSKAQEAYFNTNRDKIGSKVVDEYNKASKGKKLPDRVSKGKPIKGGRRAALAATLKAAMNGGEN